MWCKSHSTFFWCVTSVQRTFMGCLRNYDGEEFCTLLVQADSLPPIWFIWCWGGLVYLVLGRFLCFLYSLSLPMVILPLPCWLTPDSHTYVHESCFQAFSLTYFCMFLAYFTCLIQWCMGLVICVSGGWRPTTDWGWNGGRQWIYYLFHDMSGWNNQEITLLQSS